MPLMHIIIRGKWKSPGDSKDRSKDDTHEIKRRILKEIKKCNYEKIVGRNPDLDINPKTGKIVLKGQGDFSGGLYESNIDSENYFISMLIGSPPFLTKDGSPEADELYIIPNEDQVILSLIDYIIEYDLDKNVLVLIR
ncbi:MAG TPA: hypothetical protein DCS80_06350 [Betaproteobacteria bacterium]|jgi:hypothetical protein|nr:hypothetical protein [Betaproteobacteria bacterium]